MNLSALIANHIKLGVPGVSVGVAADLAAIRTGTFKLPAVFVMPWSESGADNRLMSALIAQQRRPQVAVITAVRQLRVAGEIGVGDIETLRNLVDSVLFGWQPQPTHDPFLLVSGKLLDMSNGELWWQDIYSTAYDRRTNF